MKKFLIAIPMLLLACRPTPDVVVVWADDTVLRDEVQRAADQWNSCGDALILVQEKPVENVLYVPFEYMTFSGTVVGHTFRSNNVPTSVGINKGDERMSVAHEMGHVLGLPHSADGVMQPWNPDGVVTQSDCERLAALHNK